MNYCILGSTGLLEQDIIKKYKKRNINVIGVARKNSDFNLDITDISLITDFLKSHNFDVIINTVAIVNHNICNDNPSFAYITNSRPSSILANLSDELGFKYVFISTDGYFSNDFDKKHSENAHILLLNEYARTKYCGEKFALLAKNSLVIRTNIIGYKNSGDLTFLEWILSAIKKNEEIVLFNDYFTSSICVSLFSKALLDLISKNAKGLDNLASSEVLSKKEFIEKFAKFNKLPLKATIGSVKQLKPKRPDSLGLDVSKAENILKYKLPTSD